MEENNERREIKDIYSNIVRAGKKRTYFFDVREGRDEEFYLTITESKRIFNDNGEDHFVKHKLFLYKEDFNKFLEGLEDTIGYIKEKLNPDFDYEKFDYTYEEGYEEGEESVSEEGYELK